MFFSLGCGGVELNAEASDSVILDSGYGLLAIRRVSLSYSLVAFECCMS